MNNKDEGLIIFGLRGLRYIKMKKISLPTRLGLLGALAIFLNFYLGFEAGRAQSLQVFQLAESKLLYTLSQKDDLELIDWGRSMAAQIPGLCLLATLDGQKVMVLGNPGTLPNRPIPGLHFQWPNLWLFHDLRNPEELSKAPFDLTMSLPTSGLWPGIALNLALLLLAGLLILPSSISPDPAPASPLPALPSKPNPAPHPDSDPALSLLWIDRGYLIRSSSTQAQALLGEKAKDLLGRHLLDLSPQPRLLEILASGQKGEIEDAFLPPLRLRAKVSPQSEGWNLILEVPENG